MIALVSAGVALFILMAVVAYLERRREARQERAYQAGILKAIANRYAEQARKR